MSFSFGINNISRGNTYKDKPTGGTLPLYYKDKPNSFRPISHKKQRKLVMLLKGFIYSLILYTVYHFASTGNLNLFEFGFGGGIGSDNISKGATSWPAAQEEVKQAMLDSWHTYEKYGWGYDVYHPIKQQGENMGP
ncbi:uncharacterized protein SPAPADRAFT_57836, partial [Spathaspora passalidarum NRRL Y-27907]